MRDHIIVAVPAFIALGLVGALIYRIIFEPSLPIPDILTNALTTITGYYFGVGVSSVKGRDSITIEQFLEIYRAKTTE